MTERGGGFHSLVLHLEEEHGWREYRFRSVDKFPMQGLPEALHGTAVGRILEDQVGALFPAAPLMAPPLLGSLGLLHVTPELYVMGNSARLGLVRDTVVGMLGTFELKGEEAPDDKPGFAGSRAIKGTDKLYEDLLESREHRVNEREILAARLADFLMNDPDRTMDNYDWARFGDKGNYTWRPLPRDRDQAFMNADGLLNQFVIRRVYPKQVPFTDKIPLRGLTYSTHAIDRRLLQRLTADDFREVALRVQRAVNDSVIALIVAELPRSWRDRTSADDRLTTVLRARREQLPAAAMAFYRDLASDVDVRGTDTADRIDVVRHADGRVTVTVTDPEKPVSAIALRGDGKIVTTSGGSVVEAGDPDAYYVRTFLPSETQEVRLYMNGGDDVAVVRGAASGAIKVRIIGGKGHDTLADSTGGDNTYFYDAEGNNRLLAARDTRVSTRPWKEFPVQTTFRTGTGWAPDWGGSKGWGPAFDYKTSAGVIVGVGPRFETYGFRRLPHLWKASANLLVGTANGRLGLTTDLDYRMENSPRLFRITGRATQLEPTRFFGYGNESPDVSSNLSLVEQTVITMEPMFVWQVGWRSREGSSVFKVRDSTKYSGLRPTVGEIRVGSVFGWIDPDPEIGSPLFASGVAGSGDFGMVGAKVGVELDRTDDGAVPTSGWKLEADLAGYPAIAGIDNAFGTATAGGAFYVPLMRLGGPHIAIRARGALASGDQPVQFAPAIGGRSTVRGYSWRRFAGDAAVNGGAELRVPVGTVNFLIRSQLGVFALADAGRVWFDGASDGGWHTGVGGGLWLSALGQAVSIAYAHGEAHKLYARYGLFY